MTLRYLDVCAGISAASVAWQPLGWKCVGYSEIEPFPRGVLQERFGAVPVDWDHRHSPGSNVTPLFGDFTKIEAHHVGPVDLLVGGTPCQAFSVAGKRQGLDDPRGNLAIEFLALARRIRAEWLVWENVPGVLSSWSGEPDDEAIAEWVESSDFAAFLGLFRECGYRGCWRVLDAQYVRVDGFDRAVPQRRRRVFLVGYLGDTTRAIPVLFDAKSLRGDPAPRREAREGTSAAIAPRAHLHGSGLAANGVESLAPEQVGTAAGNAPIAHTSSARRDFDSELIGASATVSSKWAKGTGGPSADECQNLIPVEYVSEEAAALTASLGGVSGKDAIHARLAATPTAFRTSPNCGAWETGDRVDALTTGSDPTAHVLAVPFDITQITSTANGSNPKLGDPCHPLAATRWLPAPMPRLSPSRPARCEKTPIAARAALAFVPMDLPTRWKRGPKSRL